MSRSFDLRSHRPLIELGELEVLRRRLFRVLPARPVIPGYEIEAELGKGAFGRVYRAFDPRFQRHVALKVVSVGSPEARARIEREAQALARLSHPHVVQVYDKGPTGDHGYFLALEHVEGCDLQKWLTQASRGLPEILAKFVEIAEGLAAAHRAGLVHRDFKPKTRWPSRTAPLPPSGRILADRGVSRRLQRHATPRCATSLATAWQRAARLRAVGRPRARLRPGRLSSLV